jgi:hypothetical protein
MPRREHILKHRQRWSRCNPTPVITDKRNATEKKQMVAQETHDKIASIPHNPTDNPFVPNRDVLHHIASPQRSEHTSFAQLRFTSQHAMVRQPVPHPETARTLNNSARPKRSSGDRNPLLGAFPFANPLTEPDTEVRDSGPERAVISDKSRVWPSDDNDCADDGCTHRTKPKPAGRIIPRQRWSRNRGLSLPIDSSAPRRRRS